MARGTARSIAASVLGLVALQAVSTSGGSGRVVEMLRDINGLVDRVLDPNVAAIPDRSRPASGAVSGLDPVATGQASQDGSSGHQWDQGGVPIPAAPRPPGTANPTGTGGLFDRPRPRS